MFRKLKPVFRRQCDYSTDSSQCEAAMAQAAKVDLLLRNGILVIPGIGQLKADVAITAGRIVALGEGLPGMPEQIFDAGGKMVLPGIFDPHTHIGNERSFEEEAETETRAAVLGGVTTIGIF